MCLSSLPHAWICEATESLSIRVSYPPQCDATRPMVTLRGPIWCHPRKAPYVLWVASRGRYGDASTRGNEKVSDRRVRRVCDPPRSVSIRVSYRDAWRYVAAWIGLCESAPRVYGAPRRSPIGPRGVLYGAPRTRSIATRRVAFGRVCGCLVLPRERNRPFCLSVRVDQNRPIWARGLSADRSMAREGRIYGRGKEILWSMARRVSRVLDLWRAAHWEHWRVTLPDRSQCSQCGTGSGLVALGAVWWHWEHWERSGGTGSGLVAVLPVPRVPRVVA